MGRAEPDGGVQLVMKRLGGEHVAEAVRRAEHHRLELVDRLDPIMRRRLVRCLQRTDRFDRTVARFRDRRRETRQHGAGRGFGVEVVVLAVEIAIEFLGSVVLDDFHARCCEVAGEAGFVAAGRLDADGVDDTLVAHPVERRLMADRGRRERGLGEWPERDRVEHGADVGVGVGVEAAGDTAACCCHHSVAPSIRLNVEKGRRSRSGQHRDGSAGTGSYQVTLVDRGSRNVVAGAQLDNSDLRTPCGSVAPRVRDVHRITKPGVSSTPSGTAVLIISVTPPVYSVCYRLPLSMAIALDWRH